ncbi:MAG: hypothetical protein NWF00_01925 [Candidatus Bathyarchaeota archaeon]|nr:hypothetical protein [Candidatus Bathyarchaeota archaeon]
MPHKTNTNPKQTLKAGAIICPICCVELIEEEVDFEIDGAILHNVKLLRCPICQEEQFTPQQQQAIEEQLRRQET